MEAASQVYFGKTVSKISIAEAALLAAKIQAPSRLSPYGDYKDELLARKDYVIDRMAEHDFIAKQEAEEAAEEEDEEYKEDKEQFLDIFCRTFGIE